MIRLMNAMLRANRWQFVVASVLLMTTGVGTDARAQIATRNPDILVYHQLTNLDADYAWVASPELSADGQVVAFGDAPGADDPATPNRILTLPTNGGEPTEVDSYVPLCYCAAQIDLSVDGSVIVSTDSVQLRLVATDGTVVQLLTATSNEIGMARVTADGGQVFFVVRRDTSLVDDASTPPRGVWRIDADGSNLRQIVSADDLAAYEGVTVDETGCCFYGDGMPLDISADGSAVAFGAYVAGFERIYTATGDGHDLDRPLDPFAYVKNVTVSADGDTVAYDAIPPDPSGQNEVGVLPFAGGAPRILATSTGSNFDDLLRLSEDGSSVLISPLGYLIETDTGTVRQLAALTPGADAHTALLYDGLVGTSMRADATQVIYIMNPTVCADCPNLHQQIGILTIGPAELGAAPAIRTPSVTPNTLTIGADDRATATADIEYSGDLVAVGAVALRDGVADINVARSAALVDDGTLGDVSPDDGTFTNDGLIYGAVVARNEDIGPRTLRFQAEVIDASGLHHATALDAGTLTIQAGGSN